MKDISKESFPKLKSAENKNTNDYSIAYILNEGDKILITIANNTDINPMLLTVAREGSNLCIKPVMAGKYAKEQVDTTGVRSLEIDKNENIIFSNKDFNEAYACFYGQYGFHYDEVGICLREIENNFNFNSNLISEESLGM